MFNTYDLPHFLRTLLTTNLSIEISSVPLHLAYISSLDSAASALTLGTIYPSVFALMQTLNLPPALGWGRYSITALLHDRSVFLRSIMYTVYLVDASRKRRFPWHHLPFSLHLHVSSSSLPRPGLGVSVFTLGEPLHNYYCGVENI